MTTDAERAVRNQQMIMLALGLTAAKALIRNRTFVAIGLVAVALVAHRKGAAASAALRSWAAANRAAWHAAKPTD
jgi:hypothetical protein